MARECKGDTVTGVVIDFSENANGGGGEEQFVKLSTFHLSRGHAAWTDRYGSPSSLASPLRQRLVQLTIMQVLPLSPFSFLLPRFFRSTAFSISPSWWRRGSTSGDSFIVSIPFLLLITSFGSKTGSLIDSFFASLLLVWERRAQVQNLGRDKRKYVEPLN